jgi:hypothetical protein
VLHANRETDDGAEAPETEFSNQTATAWWPGGPNIMKISALLFLLTVSLLWCGSAAGYSLYFDPAEQTVGLNQTAEISVWISGLGDHATPNLGAYDIEIGYDESLLQLTSITFHEYLGLSGTGNFNTLVPGVLRVYEVSVLLDEELSALQPGAFPLVSMEFRMQNLLSSQIEILEATLSDGDGIPFYAAFQSANVYAVPLPSALMLLASALMGIVGVRRLRAKPDVA